MRRARAQRRPGGAWVGLAALIGTAAPARAQSADETPCRTDYVIRARVEPPSHALAGEEDIRWTNESRDDVPDLWFHLYWNAFANNRSTHLQESGGDLRGVEIEDEWGWQRIASIQVEGKEL